MPPPVRVLKAAVSMLGVWRAFVGGLRRTQCILPAMTSRLVVFAQYSLAALWLVAVASAQIPAGIPRALARRRAANISRLHYRLALTLQPRARQVPGTVEITFRLRHASATLLDYRDGRLQRLVVNGRRVAPKIVNGHLALAAALLRPGENTVRARFLSGMGPAGWPIVQYEDHADGSEYIYTLFVPMDASMVFPCFDQPDLKGRFQLALTAPAAWTLISNTAPRRRSPLANGAAKVVFGETRPLPTYLVAFAAGPFDKLERAGEPAVYFRKSQLALARRDVPELQRITARGMRFFSAYFAQPFPFPKYDIVLIPGMAYGGMEHAGATFLREEAVLFRTATTRDDILGRDILTLHELTHQWFGDLVTMRWFDDLWLKEGFAQFMAYRALAALRPRDQVWKRFYERIKPGAYGIDETPGTTPIYQNIGNLDIAKSAYGAIVYSKAPGVLKQLWYVLGDRNFRNGLRHYLRAHAYGNATWSDLVHALEQASGRRLGGWANAWIRKRGMPQVNVAWTCSAGKLARLTLLQRDVLHEGVVWPIATEILLDEPRGKPVRLRAEFSTSSAVVPQAAGLACPDWVFANDRDYAYGRFLLDRRSRRVVMRRLGTIADPFERSLLWGALWQSVEVAQLDPRRYIALAGRLAPQERDESILAGVLGRAALALHRYLSTAERRRLDAPLAALAAAEMRQAPRRDLRIVWFHGFRGLAENRASRVRLKQLLAGSLRLRGIRLRLLDRWRIVATLVALGDPEAGNLLAREKRRDHTSEGQKYAYMAAAARPVAAVKRWYFNDYLHNRRRPEDWVQTSLGAFNYWNQAALTRPYLRPALAALPQIEVQRKIFFLVAWLDAFIGGQHSRQADAIVHRYLARAQIAPDTRLKILQALDALDRTVRIRKKYAGGK